MVNFERECGYPGNNHMSELKPPRRTKETDSHQDRDCMMTFITVYLFKWSIGLMKIKTEFLLDFTEKLWQQNKMEIITGYWLQRRSGLRFGWGMSFYNFYCLGKVLHFSRTWVNMWAGARVLNYFALATYLLHCAVYIYLTNIISVMSVSYMWLQLEKEFVFIPTCSKPILHEQRSVKEWMTVEPKASNFVK